jgi:hypothetical protein
MSEPAAPESGTAEGKVLRARYSGTCTGCAGSIDKGAQAVWFSATRVFLCLRCGGLESEQPLQSAASRPPPPAPSPRRDDDIIGTRAGGSAAAEYQRRKSAEEEAARARFGRFPRIAELIVKVTNETADTAAWGKGARGEQALGHGLGAIPGIQVLHDRLRPRSSKYNIDHIVVAATGVYVIDAKAYSGKIECVDKGTFFRPDLRLRVKGKSQDKRVDSAQRQADDVAQAPRRSGPPGPLLPRHGMGTVRRPMGHPRRPGHLAGEALQAPQEAGSAHH